VKHTKACHFLEVTQLLCGIPEKHELKIVIKRMKDLHLEEFILLM
jgi:hypothetical protein